MAVTTTYINGDIAKVKAVLESLDFFDSVTYDDDTTPTSITLKDASSNTLAVLTVSTTTVITAYLSAGVPQSATYSTGSTQINYAYSCPNGVIFSGGSPASANNNIFSILIAKTNKDTVAFVFSKAVYSSSTWTGCFKNIYCIAWGDSEPVSSYDSMFMLKHPQTEIVPFLTNSPDAHTTAAFYIMYGTYYDSAPILQNFTLVGQTYFTTGYWAIRDSEE